MSELVYVNVNEEGEEYDRHDNLPDALALLVLYPNDSVVISTKREAAELPLKRFIVWEKVVEHSTYKYVVEAETAEEARREVVSGHRDDGVQNDSHITAVLGVEVETL